ncbi:Phosphoglycerate mutase-like protein AT74 [Glycine max]|nr:Phosphoglycerate mutase-like protein AT74 [Glycine max]
MVQAFRADKHLHCVIDSDDYSPDWRVQFYVFPYTRTRSTLCELRRYFLKKRIIGVREESRVRKRDFGNFRVK